VEASVRSRRGGKTLQDINREEGMSLNTRVTDSRVKAYVKALTRTALGRTHAGRNLTVFPNDIFLVSYYRSGSTWTRFLVGNLVNNEDPVTFANVERRVPPIYIWPDRVLRSLPRIFKSHECFDPRYPRIIYILRDPRDVAVSFYYYCLKMRILREGYSMDDFVGRFISAKIVPYADRVGCWEDHVLSWLRLRTGKPGFFLLRYEDLQADPARELAKVASFLGVEATPEKIERAVSLSSASSMRSLEAKQSKEWGVTKDSRQDIRFVREAKSGGWRDKLSAASVQAIEHAWGTTMRELGYPTSSAEK
jgi:hypothetical protein